MGEGSDTALLSSRTSPGDDAKPSMIAPLVFSVLPLAIGLGLAEAIYRIDPDSNDYRVQAVKQYELHFALFALTLFGALTRFLNFYAGPLKGPAMDGRAKGNIRANMFIFKVNTESDQPPMPPVILEDRGAAGKYNRANRSLHHFVESSPGMLLNFVPAGLLFPKESLGCMALFVVGRVAHQVGYTTKGYGGHGLGFGLALLASVLVEGLVLTAAIRASTS